MLLHAQLSSQATTPIYDGISGAEKFEEHVTHHYEFLGDKLIIGKFCAIAKGIEFVMNGANHRMKSISPYPFNMLGGGQKKFTPTLDDLPLKGDTVVGKDVRLFGFTDFDFCKEMFKTRNKI